MKPLLLLLTFCTTLATAQGWEWQNPWPQGNTLNAVQALSEETIVCVGDSATFVKTSDSGITWSVRHFISGSSALRGVRLVDDSVGVAVGDDGALIRTLDGGVSWNDLNSPTSEDLHDVWFFSESTGIVIGGDGMILRTTDGGTHWGEGSTETTTSLNGLCFANPNIGIIVGSDGVILRSVDGGMTWFSQPSGTTNALNDVFFSDSNTGTVVGNAGTILRTTNGGATWSAQISGTEAPLVGVSFPNGREGVAVGLTREVFRTKNGGDTWKGFDVFPQNYLFPTFNDVCFLQTTVGYCVGSSGIILRTTDAGVSWQEISSGHTTSATVRKLSFSNAEIGIGVGYSGGYAHIPNIFDTTDGGSSWSVHFVPGNFHSVSTNSLEHASAVGEFGTYGFIRRTSNHGEVWSYIYTIGPMIGVNFADSLNGMAVGSNGAIYRTADGGFSWQSLPSGTTTHLLDVHMIDNNIAIIVGEKFQTYGILRTTDGGGSWETIPIPVRSILNAVAFANSSVGVAVGSEGAIIRTTNGGISWRPQVSNTTNTLTDVNFNGDGSVGYAVGGVILRTTDLGITWTEEQCLAAGYSVAATGNSGWTIGGANGVILHKGAPVGEDLMHKTDKDGGGLPVHDLIAHGFATWEKPTTTGLLDNYPNPFNPSTTFRYTIGQPGQVTLSVYDMLGQLVKSIVNDYQSEGYHEAIWDGKNESGASVASGIYIYRIMAGNFSATKRMLLLK